MSQSQRYVASSSLPSSIEDAFAYHERPGALRRLIPPWESVEIEHSDNSLQTGSRVVMRVKIAGIPIRWVAKHLDYDPPNEFVDTQVSGPFKSWNHRHQFVECGSYTELRDHIDYQLPLGGLGRVFGSGKARSMLEQMFAYRHRITRDDLTLQADRPAEPMRIAISGRTGLVGSNLDALLTLLGHETRAIVRAPSDDPADIAAWSDPSERAKFEEVDAVVHLAGMPVAGSRWTPAVKDGIRNSRIGPTRELCETLAGLDNPPSVLICASATGYYGNRDDEVLTEESTAGSDFLAEVAAQWEQACRPATEAGIRVVNTRLGIVLSPTGGAMQKMLLPAKLAGGAIGSGRQWWSWIALDDVLGAIYHALTDASLSGPVNLVAPEPVRNRDFAKDLAAAVSRPALLPAPAFGIRMMLGEMGDAIMLSSSRVRPTKLIEAGYRFRFDNLSEYFRYALGRERLASAE